MLSIAMMDGWCWMIDKYYDEWICLCCLFEFECSGLGGSWRMSGWRLECWSCRARVEVK